MNDLWEFNPENKQWVLVSFNSSPDAPGEYGVLGTASTSNSPSARNGAVSWTDRSGNLWLSGGYYDGTFNDLWKFDTTAKMWTWVSGSNTPNANGTYGTKGVASTSNVPGSRAFASGWIDSKGDLWLYGGSGSGDINGELADLWGFSPATNEWTWVARSNITGQAQPPVFGTQGTPSDQNTPGEVSAGAAWIDSSDNLRLFGGSSDTNLLWEFNPKTNQWVWVSGTNTSSFYGTGNYGTKAYPAQPTCRPAEIVRPRGPKK